MTPDQMSALHHACFTVPRPWSADEITDLLASPHVFAIRESGGFAMGRVVVDEAELLTLAVDPGQRRKGIGARLVQAFLQEARDRGAARVFLEVVPDNHAAVSLYLQADFTVCGRRKGYYHPAEGPAQDALVMDRAV
ncbi:MAG: GNAT family N-acetyltransferase [Paracoccaceae bacterium]